MIGLLNRQTFTPDFGHPLNRGLKGWWLATPGYNGFGSSVWRDISGNNNHGTLTGMDPGTDWGPSTRYSGAGALDFDGSNDKVDIPSISLTGEKTVAFWFKYNVLNTVMFGGASAQYYPYIDASKIYVSAISFQSISHGGLSAQTWYHIVVKGSQALNKTEAYVNGVSKGTAQDRGPTVSTIGAYSDATFSLDGQLADFRVYNRRLYDDEIVWLYHESRNGNRNLLARWDMPIGEASAVVAPTGHLYGPLAGSLGGPI